MRKNRQNEKDRRRVSKEIRDTEIDIMSSYTPSETAKKAFQRPAYKSINVLEYLSKKYDIKDMTMSNEGLLSRYTTMCMELQEEHLRE